MKRNLLKRHLLASVGLVALASASSASADVSRPAPPAAPWSWSGFYVGGHFGYGWGRDPFSDAIFGNKIPPLSGIDSKGFLGGFQAGANLQAGRWVGGLEIDLSAADINGSSSTSSGGPVSLAPGVTSTVGFSQSDKFEWLGSARARLGFLPWPNLMLYGTGGLAWTRLVQSQDFTLTLSEPGTTISAISSQSFPSWRFGWVAGAGVETRLWDSNWLARVEYLHYDFGDSGGSTSSDPTSSTSTTGNLTADVVRAGLSYKFGQNYAAWGAAHAEMPLKAPRGASGIWSWSGYYVGAHLGYGWGSDPFTESGVSPALNGVDSNGFVGGFQAGANWQRGAWVGGLEVDLSHTDVKGSSSSAVPITSPGIIGTETVKQTDKFDLLGSARARLGYVVWPSVMLYGTGGLAWTRFVQTTDESRDITSGGTSTSDSSSSPSWRFGWVAGLGAETRLWDTNWLGRIEYLHYDFGESRSSFSVGSSTTSGRLTTDVVRGGLSYKLDWDGDAAGSATSNSMPLKARPASVAAWDWSGFYLGGHAGYGWGLDPRDDEFFGAKVGQSPALGDINSHGFVAGFQGGANWQLSNWVSGLEIDLSATGIKGSSTSAVTSGGSTTIETDTDKFEMLGSARARLGYLAWRNVLLYGTGGLAWTHLVQDSTTLSAGEVRGNSSPIWELGWVAGAGVETKVWDSNWLLRLEYLHYDFGDSGNNSSTAVQNGLSGSANFTSGHLTTDVVRTGLSYKFN